METMIRHSWGGVTAVCNFHLFMQLVNTLYRFVVIEAVSAYIRMGEYEKRFSVTTHFYNRSILLLCVNLYLIYITH